MVRRSLLLASAVALALAAVPSARACAAHGNLDAASLDAALAAATADAAAAAASDADVLVDVVGGCGCGGLGRNNAAPRTRAAKGKDGAVEEILAPGDASDTAAAWRAANTVMIPAGRFHMGTDVDGIKGDGEGPARWVEITTPYAMDRTETTNAQFAEFVAATGHLTDAEKYGWSFVFEPQLSEATNAKATEAVQQSPWWLKIEGANWAHPYGPDSDVSTLADHPVVHVSYNDAEAYCKWRGGRVPTETEWERAARGGIEDQRFPWGDELEAGGVHHANVWQGKFPEHNTVADGWTFTAPATSYEPNAYGLYNMVGNVWEWSRSPFVKSSRKVLATRGGSFLCHESYCYRYRNSARTRNEPDSSTSNMGFRCVYPAP